MNALLTHRELDRYLDRICASGCAQVNRMIAEMENGRVIEEIAHLPRPQQQQILFELKSVMSVYTSCSVD
jgi:hypothetical protein